MTKYSSYHRSRPQKTEKPHPVWRGIGCLIIILVPAISYAAAKITIDYGLTHEWRIPFQLLGIPTLPDFVLDVPILYSIFSPLRTIRHFYAYLTTTLLYIMVLGGLLSFGYALVYRFVGPPRWGPQDIPPPKGIKSKPYKR